MAVIYKIHDGNFARIDIENMKENGECALRDRSATQDEKIAIKLVEVV
jgi:hypothetical protein